MGSSWRDYVKYGEKGQQNPAAKRALPSAFQRWYKGHYQGSKILAWRKRKAQEAKYVREYLQNG